MPKIFKSRKRNPVLFPLQRFKLIQMDGTAPVETVDEMPKLIQNALRTQGNITECYTR